MSTSGELNADSAVGGIMRNAPTFAFLGALCAQGYPADEPGPAIPVLVYDHAGVSAEVFHAGLKETRRILKSGGVEVVWIHCPVTPDRLALERPCRDDPGPLTLVVHIRPHGPVSRQK